jgi:uncharacterized membrane protein YgcG
MVDGIAGKPAIRLTRGTVAPLQDWNLSSGLTAVRTSGRDVLRELRSALDDARNEAAELRRQSQQFDQQVTDFAHQRADSFLQLARMYLPELNPTAISNSFDGIREELDGILARKARTRDEVAGRISRLIAEQAKTTADLTAVTTRLNEKVSLRETLRSQLAELLKDNPEFQDLSRQAVANEAELKKNEGRVAEIERDAKEKLPAYERSKLFQYLYDRKFGTPDYTETGMERSLDRWVARLIGYERARTGYAFLTTTPRLMREEVERRKAEFQMLMGKVQELEQFGAEKIGLTVVLRDGEALGRERDQLVARFSDVQQRVLAAEQELAEVERKEGKFYMEALSRLQTFLMKVETSVLERKARATPERADDDLVAKIHWLTTEIDRIRPQVQEFLNRTNAAEQQNEAMEFAVRRYQQSNFDSDRSYFEFVPNLEAMIGQLKAGVLSKEEFWNAYKRRQQFEQTPTDLNLAAIVTHPLTEIAVRTLVHVAAASLSSGGGGGGRSGGGSSRQSSSGGSFGGSSFGGGSGDGFTSGEGF